MRNLALHALITTDFPIAKGAASQIALNLDDGTTYCITERINGDADVEWEIWRLRNGETAQPQLCTTFTGASAVWPTSFKSSQLASTRYLPEQGILVLITRGGNIASYAVDDHDTNVDIVGSIEEGILAASWSPDDSILVLLTEKSKLMLMTPTFDVLYEAPLNTSDFGSDAPINVGWGSKETQFHGSLGKTAAQAPSTPQRVGSSPDDDRIPRISWRGDGSLFVVSSLEHSLSESSSSQRCLRVYDRLGALQSTSEPVPGLEHNLSWRHGGPGSLIVGTQRFGFPGGGAGKPSRHDVVFIERNGLRHGEFSVRPPRTANLTGEGTGERKSGYRVREVLCSAGADVVALWIEGDEGDIVQLWTTGNYHWYLKQEIAAPSNDGEGYGRFGNVIWHPEEPLTLLLLTAKQLIKREYISEIWTSASEIPNDSGSVAVTDGDTILLTPFRTQKIPPPMSSYQLRLAPPERENINTPVHVAFAPDRDHLAALYEHGVYRLWSLHTRLGPGPGPVMKPELIHEGVIPPVGNFTTSWKHIVLPKLGYNSEIRFAAMGTGPSQQDVVALVDTTGSVLDSSYVEPNGRLVPDAALGSFWWQSPTGELRRVLKSSHEDDQPSSSFPNFCPSTRATVVNDVILHIGLSSSGNLYASTSRGSHTLATNATSFTIASDFVIYTTSAHEAHFASLPVVASLCGAVKDHGNADQPVWELRRVERGARIVCAVPSALALVLQMPRGNLEIIAPRPLVMAVVKQDIAVGEWRKAFDACRKHRIDLTTLVENTKLFMESIPAFVEQINDVDYFGLFLTGVSRSNLSAEVINDICDKVRAELERKDLRRFTNAVLTAYVVKSPPEPEAALRLLLKLRDDSPDSVEDALKYLVFLVDADTLFDIALGMYDFGLVLLVAQHAKKDPREYLPFLRHLRDLPDLPAQRFAIDDHLRRYPSALCHLREAGDGRFEEAMIYASRHRLLPDALRLWRGSERERDVLATYAEDLYERREFKQAALAFVQADRNPQALAAYERALDWRNLFALAAGTGMSESDIKETGYRVAEELGSKKRHIEAGSVLLEHCADVRHAVMAFVEGNAFSEARRVIALNAHKTGASAEGAAVENNEFEDLVETIVFPGLFDSAAQITEDLADMRTQMGKQRARVRELRERKVTEPESFYGEDNPALAGVDVMTDVSQPGTAFTRYTVAPTSVSRTSTKKSSKQRRKAERNAGKKGTVDEEEYLLRSFTKLTVRFSTSSVEVDKLLPHLLQSTPKHRKTARDLLENADSLRSTIGEAIDEIWAKTEDPPEAQDFHARLTQSIRVEAVDKVPKPDAPVRSEWRVEVVDALQ